MIKSRNYNYTWNGGRRPKSLVENFFSSSEKGVRQMVYERR
jgi:hypothetical protein